MCRRCLCNGRIDWDIVFPDKSTSIQKHQQQTSTHSFMEDERVSIGRGGSKQGAESRRPGQHHANAAGVAAEAVINHSISQSIHWWAFFCNTFCLKKK